MRKSLFSSVTYGLDNMATSIVQPRPTTTTSCSGADSVFYSHTCSKQPTAEALSAQRHPQPNMPEIEVRFANQSLTIEAEP